MSRKTDMLGKSISTLVERYQYAISQPWVIKPMSYALYHTWKAIDNIEKPRKGKQDEIND